MNNRFNIDVYTGSKEVVMDMINYYKSNQFIWVKKDRYIVIRRFNRNGNNGYNMFGIKLRINEK